MTLAPTNDVYAPLLCWLYHIAIDPPSGAHRARQVAHRAMSYPCDDSGPPVVVATSTRVTLGYETW